MDPCHSRQMNNLVAEVDPGAEVVERSHAVHEGKAPAVQAVIADRHRIGCSVEARSIVDVLVVTSDQTCLGCRGLALETGCLEDSHMIHSLESDHRPTMAHRTGYDHLPQADRTGESPVVIRYHNVNHKKVWSVDSKGDAVLEVLAVVLVQSQD